MKNIGTTYLLHLIEPLAHSRHYCGFSKTPEEREARHAAGNGARMLRAAKENGIDFIIAREWPNTDRHFERKIHNRKNSPQICPICSGPEALNRANYLSKERDEKCIS